MIPSTVLYLWLICCKKLLIVYFFRFRYDIDTILMKYRDIDMNIDFSK